MAELTNLGRQELRQVLGVFGFNHGVDCLGTRNAMRMPNLIPMIVFAIEACLRRGFRHGFGVAADAIL